LDDVTVPGSAVTWPPKMPVTVEKSLDTRAARRVERVILRERRAAIR
jgi:hypothetical protein